MAEGNLAGLMDFKEQRLFTHGYQRMCMVLYRAKGGLWGHRQSELPARDCGGRCVPWPCAPGRSSSAQGPGQVRDTCIILLWTPGNPVNTCSLAVRMPHESRRKRVQYALWPGAILRTMIQAAAHLCNSCMSCIVSMACAALCKHCSNTVCSCQAARKLSRGAAAALYCARGGAGDAGALRRMRRALRQPHVPDTHTILQGSLQPSRCLPVSECQAPRSSRELYLSVHCLAIAIKLAWHIAQDSLGFLRSPLAAWQPSRASVRNIKKGLATWQPVLWCRMSS